MFEHLDDCGKSYFEHLAFAFKISFMLLLISFILVIHGVFPGLYSEFASQSIRRINEDFKWK